MGTVNLNIPSRPKGSKVEIPGLGLLINGEANQIDDVRWERFKRSRSDLQIEDEILDLPEKVEEQVDELQQARAVALHKATKAQLELLADAEGVDLSEASNNDERVALIEAARNPQE